MTISIICLLDKDYPPDHSFVTGMLANVLPKEGGMRVYMIVGSPHDYPARPCKYHRARCLPVLPQAPRRGLRRISSAIIAWRHAKKLIKRLRVYKRPIALFVRNDPFLLGVASALRSRVNKLVFQSSFPLYETHNSGFKRWIHRSLYRMSARRVDSVLGVSPLGLRRVMTLIPWAAKGEYIPLLSDLEFGPTSDESRASLSDAVPVRFVYAGTHQARRELNVVLEGIVRALDLGCRAEFCFVGGSDREISALREEPRVVEAERRGAIKFTRRVSRTALAKLLTEFDVGISAIPPHEIYKEASPSKLAEYMAAGLAVLATSGIPLQDEFVSRSGGGIIVRFDPDSIASGIRALCESRSSLDIRKQRSRIFAEHELTYRSYLSQMQELLC